MMKKAINLKATMDAYRAMDRAKNNVSFYRDLCKDGWAPDKLTSAQERLASARSALADASAALTAEIESVQTRCRERLINAEAICRKIVEIETDRFHGISKKNLEGTTITALDLNAQSFPNAYKWRPESTQVDLLFKSGSWRVTAIYRGRCDKNGGYITLSDTARTAILSAIASL